MSGFVGLLGIAAMILVAWAFSTNRREVKWKPVIWALALQFVFGILILGIPKFHIPGLFRVVFVAMNDLVNALVSFSDKGADFVFGPLGKPDQPTGYIFAFRALPPIIFFSSLTALLYHLGVLQRVVGVIARVMQKTLHISGAESLSTAANIFIGQTEAPLLVRPYIAAMTNSEIFCIMVGGMATVAAGVMGAYVELLKARVPDIAGHLLTASVMSAPAAILVSKIMIPESERPETMGQAPRNNERIDSNAVEAAARGAAEGVALAINVAAMLIAFIALIALADSLLAWAGTIFGFAREGDGSLSFSILLGWIFSPVAWLLGVPAGETSLVGKLLGEKVILNEFVAYVHMAAQGDKLSDRTLIITAYALCGFANFSSIGIQIGGLGTLAPNQRGNVARLGFLAVLGGTLACFITGAIAGLLY